LRLLGTFFLHALDHVSLLTWHPAARGRERESEREREQVEVVMT